MGARALVVALAVLYICPIAGLPDHSDSYDVLDNRATAADEASDDLGEDVDDLDATSILRSLPRARGRQQYNSSTQVPRARGRQQYNSSTQTTVAATGADVSLSGPSVPEGRCPEGACLTCEGTCVLGYDCSWVDDEGCITAREIDLTNQAQHVRKAQGAKMGVQLAEVKSASGEEKAYCAGDLSHADKLTDSAFNSLHERKGDIDKAFFWEAGVEMSKDGGAHVNTQMYLDDARETVRDCKTEHGLKFLVTLGDSVPGDSIWQQSSPTANGAPVLSKARSIGDTNVGLMPIRSEHHWANLEFEPSVPQWEDKTNTVIWRGGPPGDGHSSNRKEFVSELFGNGFDVKFIGAENTAFKNEGYAKGEKMSRAKLLSHKYLLALEGNDVATGLAWMLGSNSVVIMPKPTKETAYMMHGRLKAGEHYVELTEPGKMGDLLQKLQANGDEWNKRIIANANQYILSQKERLVDDPTALCEVITAHGMFWKEPRGPKGDSAAAPTLQPAPTVSAPTPAPASGATVPASPPAPAVSAPTPASASGAASAPAPEKTATDGKSKVDDKKGQAAGASSSAKATTINQSKKDTVQVGHKKPQGAWITSDKAEVNANAKAKNVDHQQYPRPI